MRFYFSETFADFFNKRAFGKKGKNKNNSIFCGNYIKLD